ncbi:MAG: type III secretion system chaperone [Verrucomicrobiota bacterium]
MNIPDTLTELGRQMGMADLALNDSGLCRVVFDQSLVVDFEEMDEGRTLHISSTIASLDDDTHGELYFQTMLSANLLGVATGGACFSIAEEDSEVIFERRLEMISLDFTGFSQAVESFVNHLEGWKEKLGTVPADHASSTAGFEPHFHLRA